MSGTYTLVGPINGTVYLQSAPFTITPSENFIGTITPATTLAGTFSPTSLTWSNTEEPQTFTFTPSAVGSGTIYTTNNAGLSDPSPLSFAALSAPICVITNAGIAEIVSASPTTPSIPIASFKIGSDLIISDGSAALQALTSVQSGGTNTAVFTQTEPYQLLYKAPVGTSEVAYLITLDETIGNFTIGNIGLYTTDGTLFAILALNTTVFKQQTSGSILGNRKVYEILINFSNAATIIDLTVVDVYTFNFATVPTPSSLPPPSSPPYNAYLVESDPAARGNQTIYVTNGTFWNGIAPENLIGNYQGYFELSSNFTIQSNQAGYVFDFESTGSNIVGTLPPASGCKNGDTFTFINSGNSLGGITTSGTDTADQIYLVGVDYPSNPLALPLELVSGQSAKIVFTGTGFFLIGGTYFEALGAQIGYASVYNTNAVEVDTSASFTTNRPCTILVIASAGGETLTIDGCVITAENVSSTLFNDGAGGPTITFKQALFTANANADIVLTATANQTSLGILGCSLTFITYSL